MKTDQLIFKTKKTKTILFTIGSLLFTIGTLYIEDDNKFMSIAGPLFFGLCTLVFIIQLIPGASQLKITSDGFEITNLFKKDFISWNDIKEFKTGYISSNEMVLMDYADNHKKMMTGKKISRFLSGSHGALPDTYGMKAAELCRIMNEWKNAT